MATPNPNAQRIQLFKDRIAASKKAQTKQESANDKAYTTGKPTPKKVSPDSPDISWNPNADRIIAASDRQKDSLVNQGLSQIKSKQTPLAKLGDTASALATSLAKKSTAKK